MCSSAACTFRKCSGRPIARSSRTATPISTWRGGGVGRSFDASANLGNTISYFSGYVENIEPDMIIVHGDRMDALAGAIVGALHNIMVGHIEGGEISGTIDESIRHAISKFAHVHFVCTDEARNRLIQLGEESSRIYVIGSPDIDVMMSGKLPTLSQAKKRYAIDFDKYAILMYHPVTTEYKSLGDKIKTIVDAAIDSGKNYIVVYPNNDLGSELILHEYDRFRDNARFRVFPSIRFEHFLTLMKYASFMIGNSSAGVREAGIYGIPAIDVGSRQHGRYNESHRRNIIHVQEDHDEIIKAIDKVESHAIEIKQFGDGNSTERFHRIINEPKFWQTEIQKHFVDFQS
ncbi:MAG: UDP-N-acetylglucosamine 2-epimerase (hydrolyzing) [Selenomonadaceae bacterium]|nr:UDP-N-acetylglucosamine 2-epimerase (hydrolyzing) [Selenomonadaceae bacterium]